MAGVTKVNGGVGAVGEVQFYGGSLLKFFGIVVKDVSANAVNVSAENGVGESLEILYQTIATKATPVAIQIENASSGQVSVAVEQNGAGWTAATLQTALRALGTTVGSNNLDYSGTTVTDTGLKLALS